MRSSHIAAAFLLCSCAMDPGTEDEVAEVEAGVLTSNALTSNALTSNALTSNALTSNALTSNALTSNALTSNALTSNALTSNALADASSRAVFKYVYSCAMPAGSQVDVVAAGATYTFAGELGLAPAWGAEGGSCDASCRRWISACVLARINAYGIKVDISLRGPHPALQGISTLERNTMPLMEAAFYGDIFGETPDLHTCIGTASNEVELTKRICAASQACPIEVEGFCDVGPLAAAAAGLAATPLCDTPDADGAVANCRTEDGAATYAEVVTVYMKDPDAQTEWLLDMYALPKKFWSANRRKAHLGDFNGDGRTDVLLQGQESENESFLLTARAGGRFTYVEITDAYGMTSGAWSDHYRELKVSDFNGDGFDDLILRNRNDGADTFLLYADGLGGFQTRQVVTYAWGMTPGRWKVGARFAYPGDFNGDGRDDLFLQGDNSDNGSLLLLAAAGGGFHPARLLSGLYGLSESAWCQDRKQVSVGDFNGDGRDDVLLQGRTNDRPTSLVRGAPDGFVTAVTITTSFGMTGERWGDDDRKAHVGDFNGDGRDDLLLQGRNSGDISLLLFGTTYGFTTALDVTARATG